MLRIDIVLVAVLIIFVIALSRRTLLLQARISGPSVQQVASLCRCWRRRGNPYGERHDVREDEDR